MAALAPAEKRFQRLYVKLELGMDVAALSERLSRGIIASGGNLRIEEAKTSTGERRGFGYVSLASASDGRRLVEVYNNTKWKGFRLQVQPANPSHMERLEKEWQDRDAAERKEAQDRAASAKLAQEEKHHVSAERSTILRVRPRAGAEVRHAAMQRHFDIIAASYAFNPSSAPLSFPPNLSRPHGIYLFLTVPNQLVEVDTSRSRKKTKFAEVRARSISDLTWTYAPEIPTVRSAHRQRRATENIASVKESEDERSVDTMSQEEEEEEEESTEDEDTEGDDIEDKEAAASPGFTSEDSVDEDAIAEDSPDEDLKVDMVKASQDAIGLELEEGERGAGDMPPSTNAEEVRQEMTNEARHSLSLLSSFLGTDAPSRESGGGDADTAAVPVELKIFQGGSENKHAFQPLERFWGTPGDATRLIEEPAVGARKEKGNGEAGEGKTETAHFSAKWSALKSVFHEQGSGSKNVPETGFSEKENPLNLSGFIPAAERKSKTQEHEFGFSFSLSPEESGSSQAEDAGSAKKDGAAVGHAGGGAGRQENVLKATGLAIWEDEARLKQVARKFLTTGGSEPPGDWQEHRRSLLRDAKRRLRHL